ncbi:transcriptional regulator, partial [Candidatus Dependentiae bacterium]|nr:transcriptional regulator [Candidatus Dependentiae bacterium]
ELRKIEPHADVDINYVAVKDNRYVIVISTQRENRAPYLYDNGTFMRNQSTTSKMPQAEYEQLLINRRSTINWDGLTTNNCTINDLDRKLIQRVIGDAIQAGRVIGLTPKPAVEQILRKLNLLVGDKLTNAAVVLFCKDEDKQFTQSEIKLARFLGTDKSEFLDSKIYRGNVFELYDRAMIFLGNHLPVAAKIEEGNLLRVETPAIPHKVLREAVVNALCHRNYSMQSGSISIAIYDDRVEIISAGRLPSDIKLSDLTKSHESHPRNKLIAHVFYLCCMIERWGRGTRDIVKICEKSGNPRPRFEESTGTFSVIFPLKNRLRPFAYAQ